jgi:HD-like signal output (HDOD) protein
MTGQASSPPSTQGIKALLKIPAFPPIALRLIQLLNDDNVMLGDLLELLRSDPGFSAEILRRANSPLFDVWEPVTTLQHALVVLGLRQLRNITMTVAAENYLNTALGPGELRRRCWRHMVASAILTEELACVCGTQHDAAYTFGLMHDIGRLGLLAAHVTRYAEVLDGRLAAENPGVLQVEREEFGMDHCQAGHWLAGKWNLPTQFQTVASRHHQPLVRGPVNALELVKIGTRLCANLGFDLLPGDAADTPEWVKSQLPADAQDRFLRSADELRTLVETRIRALEAQSADAPPPQPKPEPAAVLELELEPEPAAAPPPKRPGMLAGLMGRLKRR